MLHYSFFLYKLINYIAFSPLVIGSFLSQPTPHLGRYIILLHSTYYSTFKYKMSQEPEKRIFDSADVAIFRRSEAYEKIHLYMSTFINRVKGKDVPLGYLAAGIVTRNESDHKKPAKADLLELSAGVKEILAILRDLDLLIDETPPLTTPRRFGNMACREWHQKVKDYSTHLFSKVSDRARIDLCYYLRESFGSKVRLDYGSGHELNFVTFLGAYLNEKKALKDISGEEILAIFAEYYDLVRRLIIDYNLEPAGSHGVWGLDDHFHFIYVLGAAQFNVCDGGHADGARYVPSVAQVLEEQTLDMNKTSNLYINAIAFIFKIKTGPFNEHSPMINDIHRSVSVWAKVSSGLQKMYEVEVLGKFPVVQHFHFGYLYTWKDAATHQPLPSSKPENDYESTLPGMINGFEGTKTTQHNVSLTSAPWAMQGRAPTMPAPTRRPDSSR